MGRPTFASDDDQLERVIHQRNVLCSFHLLEALHQHHGDPMEAAPLVEPEPKQLPPIPNEVFREAASFSEEITRGFSDVIRVLKAVSTHTGVPISEMRSERREQRIVKPRQYVYYLSKKLTTASMPAIGRQLRKDHTSVLSGIRKIEKLRRTDAKIEADLQAVAASLGGSLA